MVKEKAIGIITNDRHAVFQKDVIKGVTYIAQGHGYEVIVDSIAEDPHNPKPISLDIAGLSGLIVIANVLSDDELHRIYDLGTPITLISHHVPDLPIPAIVSNNLIGVEYLTNHFVQECKRDQILFVRGNMEQSDARQRERAFRDSLTRLDLQQDERLFVDGDFVPEQAAQAIKAFLKQDIPFNAVFASDYLMALAIIDVLRGAGWRVPEDICVAGFGDGPQAAEGQLTTVAADIVDLGRRGARQLIGQINGLAIYGLTILSTQLIVRQSTMCRK